MKMKRDLSILLIMLLILVLLPVAFHDDSYIMHILIMSLIWSGVVVGWDLIMGYAGIFTFGQVAFFVFGAYASGMLTIQLGISPWLGILLGGIVVSLVGILIALPCLRLRGVYIALVTFAFHMVLAPLIKVGGPIGTGGSLYLKDIPPLVVGGYTFSVIDKLPWYYLILAVSTLLYLATYKIIHSSLGLAFVAMRDAEPLARSLGINYYKTNLQVFGISAFITGIIGGFYVSYVGIISTRILGLDTFLIIMVMLIVGGMGRFPGVIIGAFAVTFLSDLLRPLEVYRLLIFGAIVVLGVIFMRQGVMGVLDSVSPAISQRLGRIKARSIGLRR